MVKHVAVTGDLEKVWDLAERAQKGDKSALPGLRKGLADPRLVEMLGGNLGEMARSTLLDKYSGKNLLASETIMRKMELMSADLAGVAPTPLESLLVDQVVSCWLHLSHLEAVYANKGEMTLTLAAHYQRCISAAQKRYLAAIKTLAIVRKLAVPVLQVNIARKQVNVAAANLANPGEAR